MIPDAVDWSLYAILDKEFIKDRPIEIAAKEAIQGGAGVIQLRNKSYHSDEFYEDATKVREVTEQLGVPLIINDRLDIALAVNAAGVHLGQEDLPHTIARELIGQDMILGVSVHSLEEFRHSADARPDYFGVGTIYSSRTKSELPKRGIEIIQVLRSKTTRPLIAVGGITPENLAPVIRAGADGVAVISALWCAENIEKRAKEFVQQLARGNTLSQIPE